MCKIKIHFLTRRTPLVLKGKLTKESDVYKIETARKVVCLPTSNVAYYEIKEATA